MAIDATRALPIAFEEVSVVKRPRRKPPRRKASPHRAESGSPRFYPTGKFTPEQISLDDSLPRQTTKIFYGGKRPKVDYKDVSGVFWQVGARRRPLRLLVVPPTRYRKKSGRYHYRQPAYLLTTVVNGTARQLLQIYFDRWRDDRTSRNSRLPRSPSHGSWSERRRRGLKNVQTPAAGRNACPTAVRS
ncbi:MAG: hypothetical protein AAB225_15785 [Acidobacteriota bacterium]